MADGDQTIVVPAELAKANAAKDAAMRARIEQEAIKSNTEMEAAISYAKAHNPKIDRQIFQDIIDARGQELQWFVKNFAESSKVDPTNGAEKTEDWLRAQKIKAEEEMQTRVLQSVKALNYQRHPEATTPEQKAKLDIQVAEAYAAIKREVPSPSVTDMVTKPFYDNEKGGAQKGGIFGGLAGLVAGIFLTGGLEGGFMGIIATALLTVAGVWAGNKIVESYDASNSTPTTPKDEKAKGPKKAAEKGQDMSRIPGVAGAAEKANIKAIFTGSSGPGGASPVTPAPTTQTAAAPAR